MPRAPEGPKGPESYLSAVRDPGRSMKQNFKGRPFELAARFGLRFPEKPAAVMQRLGIYDEEYYGPIMPGLRELIFDVCTLEIEDAVIIGPRGGGKSMGVSFIEFFLWMIEDFDCLNFGGSETQAANVYTYLLGYLESDPYWLSLVKGESKISETETNDKAWIKVLTASPKQVRSPHAGGEKTVHGKRVERGGLLVIDEEAEADPDLVATVLPTVNTARPSVTVRSCFVGNTLISMADGTPKAIEEVEVGDEVLSLNARSLVPQKVIAVHKRWLDGEVLLISPSGQPEICVTPEHMLFSGAGELPAEEAAANWLVSPKRSLHYTSPRGFWSGWIIGFFLAEGSFRKIPSGNSHEVMFSVHADEAEAVAKILYEYAHERWPTTAGVRGSRYPRIVYDKRGKSATVLYACRALRQMLEREVVEGVGYSQKWLREMPTQRNFAEGVLKGWLAGDGTHYTIEASRIPGTPLVPVRGDRPSVDGTSACRALAWQMRQLAIDLNHKAGITSHTQGEQAKGAGNTIWRVSVNCVADPRWWRWQSRQGVRSTSRRNGLLCRSSCTDKSFSGWVYDLTIEGDHTYVANGILCHNSTFHNAEGSFAEVVDNHVTMGYKLYTFDIFDMCQGCECTGGAKDCQSEELCFREDHYETFIDPDTGKPEKRLIHKAYCGGRAKYAGGHIPMNEIGKMWRRWKRNHNKFEVEAMGSRPGSSGFVIKDRIKLATNKSERSGESLYIPGSPVSICIDWGTVAAGLSVWQEQPGDNHLLVHADLVEEAGTTEIFGRILGYWNRYIESVVEVAADIGGGGNYNNPALREQYRLPVRDTNFAEEKEAGAAAWNIYSEAGKLIIPAEHEEWWEEVKAWKRKNGRIAKGNDHLMDSSLCYFAKFVDRLGLTNVRVLPRSFRSSPSHEQSHEERMARSMTSSGSGMIGRAPLARGLSAKRRR